MFETQTHSWFRQHQFPFLAHLFYQTEEGDKEEKCKDLEVKKQEQLLKIALEENLAVVGRGRNAEVKALHYELAKRKVMEKKSLVMGTSILEY